MCLACGGEQDGVSVVSPLAEMQVCRDASLAALILHMTGCNTGAPV